MCVYVCVGGVGRCGSETIQCASLFSTVHLKCGDVQQSDRPIVSISIADMKRTELNMAVSQSSSSPITSPVTV